MTLRRSMPFWGRKTGGELPFISTWRTTNTSSGSSASNQVRLPLVSTGTYNFVVNWGDGSEDIITVWNQAAVTHTYAATGDYTVTITGTIIGWAFSGSGDRLKILGISQWGAIVFKPYIGAFEGVFRLCANLNVTATDAPTFEAGAQVNFFSGCASLVYNSSINDWDVSVITNFSGFFDGCTLFNQPVGGWNTSNNTSLNVTFRNAPAFNQDISGWNTGNVTIFTSTFLNASAFNQNIGAWDVSKGTSFTNMFESSAFNNGGSSSINSWNTSAALNFTRMFGFCPFNQPIGSWDVSKVTAFTQMFENNSAFNQDISGWNTGAATGMAVMFRNATSFNQNIGGWNVSNVLAMQQMFFNADAFNQNIGGWNVSKVSNMNSMFASQANFNQNLGGWNVSLVTDFTSFMASRTAAQFSAANLDAIYNGWTNRSLSVSEAISFGTIKYTAAATAARALLTRANATVTVTNAANNGLGLIRITTGAAHGRTTGDKVFISGVTGTTEANGGWIVTVIDATTIDLQASTFTNTYVSGGTVRSGYGWTITDGGL